jgi:arabinogalactan oligomer/maltooligosaccharide transport system substrate-binding protein
VTGAPARSAAANVTVWTYLDRGEQTARKKREVFEKIVAAYNATRGTLASNKVTVHFYEFDAFADRIANAVPRGLGPDVFDYPQDRLGGWVQAGNTVEPLDAVIPPSVRARFIPATLDAMKYRGHLYGLPFGFTTLTLIYNKKLVPSPPKTTAELTAVARKFTNREAGTYGFLYEYINYYHHAALQNGCGGGPFDEAMRPALDRPENLRAMHLLVSWLDLFPENLTDERAVALFNEGKAAMIFGGPWILGDLSPSIDYGFSRLPAISECNDRPMRPWLTVVGAFLAAPSRNKEAAVDFMKYLTDFDASRVLAIKGGGLAPANQTVYLDQNVANIPAMAAYAKQVLFGVPMPNTPEMTLIWPAAFTAMTKIVGKKATPEQALSAAQTKVSRSMALLHNPPPQP